MMQAMGLVLHEPYVTTKHGQLRSKRKANTDPISAVDDLATLENLEEDVIVDQLAERYERSEVYTFMGDILLAVNPFTPLKIYTNQHSKLYRNCCKADNPPHIFAIADQCYQSLVHNRHNQCIVISGESGAGKTQSANYIIQQLTQLGRAANRTLENRILQVNPLVEAFGNARTVINDNSSRFGKYLEMTFTGNGKVTGSRLSEYLLEKSRVVHQAEDERNFHVFYYIHDGLAQEDKLGRYHLNNPRGFRYLNEAEIGKDSANNAKSSRQCNPALRRLDSNLRTKYLICDLANQNNCVVVSCYHKCGKIVSCMTLISLFPSMRCKQEEVNAIYSILAAILHLGNLEFSESESKHNTVSAVKNTHIIDICEWTPKAFTQLHHSDSYSVADLLGIDGKELTEALTTSGMVARGETIIRHYSTAEAVNVRDAMAKAMYGRLFSWIVNKTNTLLKPAKSMSQDDEDATIGILDIFGFENFQVNSFEQLCINIANEQIQYYFNQHIFAWEQQEYKNEGINVGEISFVDNRLVLDMFLAKPVGLLALLDEESNFPKATDVTLVEKFGQNLRSQFFSRPRSQALTFAVDHYAGKVEYDATGFLEKNRDRLASEMISVMRLSQISLVRSLFNSHITKTGNLAYNSLGSGANSANSSTGSSVSIRSASNGTSSSQSRTQQTIATYFRYSLMDLLSKMVAGTPHFVRCIRPNVENSPGFFDKEKVMLQLRYTGVLETTKIRRQGFSHRIAFSEFLRRYYILGFNFNEKVRVNKESCELLLERIGLENWALGKTKVFLKYYHIEQLQRKFVDQQRRVVLAQAVMRMWLAKRRFRKHKEKRLKAALIIQKYARGWLVRRKYRIHDRARAALLIQRTVKGFLTRRRYRPELLRRHSAIVALQAAARGFVQRRRYAKLHEESLRRVVKLQSVFRGQMARQNVRLMRMAMEDKYCSAAVTLQKYFRMWKAQANLVNMQLQMINGSDQPLPEPEDSQSETSEAPSETPSERSLPPDISLQRKEKIVKMFSTKSSAFDRNAATYYDALNNASIGTKESRKGKLKRLMTAEGLDYYDNIVAEMNKANDIKTSSTSSQKASTSDDSDDYDFYYKFDSKSERDSTRDSTLGSVTNDDSLSDSIDGIFYWHIPEMFNDQSLDDEDDYVMPQHFLVPSVPHLSTFKPKNPEARNSVALLIKGFEKTESNQPAEQPKSSSAAKAKLSRQMSKIRVGAGLGKTSHPNSNLLVKQGSEDDLGHNKSDHSLSAHPPPDVRDDMFRSAMATTAASKFLANRPSGGIDASPDLYKSDSEQSLAWDSILEQARQKALAPDAVQRDLDLASDLGTGTPSSLMDSDTEDITEEDDYFLSSESTEYSDPTLSSSLLSSETYSSPSQWALATDADTESVYETPGSWCYESFGPVQKLPPKQSRNYQLPWRPNNACQRAVVPTTNNPSSTPPGFPQHTCNCPACQYTSWLQALSSADHDFSKTAAPDYYQFPPSHAAPRAPDIRVQQPSTQNLMTSLPKEHFNPLYQNKQNLVRPVPPWKAFYPPTPPIPKNSPDYQTIPAPPRGPAPTPPGFKRNIFRPLPRKPQKSVRFSGCDDVFIRPPSLIDEDDDDDDKENTTEIEIIHRIEDDELVYREELIEEQDEMKEQMILHLELQRKNSVSARFKKREKAQQEQEQMETRWRQIQEEDGAELEEGAYRKILSRGPSLDAPTPPAKAPLSPSPLTANTPSDIIPGPSYLKVLRRTDIDPEKLEKPKDETSSVNQVDFRSVLKKKEKSRFRNKPS
ncbi:hypothetical protein CAPTEDRAFT_226099 [Capitella teleta]|uniref:non-specific serine/threonine protein kinase n=1 Tax=Capitella teleta TaxID=283909 RepID=R7V4L1_CAPTE|nr:hypothetical protein CAPTEDRAFT_226099 [Capitella teleta]|eukprot:ELU11296.1 hypothetical protein CAPTEDRAFT_226099 [Capitella teleta]